jgi:hypothetical protein
MKQHQLESDLVVVGGGLSGVCAAIAAARNGARVILLQDRSLLGGNASSEVKMHVVGADCHGTRPGARESGIIEELKLEDAARNPHRSYSQWDLLLYEKVMTEKNITLLLDTACVGCSVNTSGDRRWITELRALRTSTEDEFIIRAPFFADCSGDGRLGKEAGASFVVGREAKSDYGESLAVDIADHQTLGSSILFTARRYDTIQPFVAPAWIRKFEKQEFAHRPIKAFEYGYWWFEWGGHLDTLKDNAEIRHELLRIALGVWDYVKNSGEHPDSANWALEWVGSIPGKRETRRFLGPHILTEHDVRAGRVFADQVAYGGWWLDLHPPSGVDAIDEQPCVQHHFRHLFTIPLRCLYSRNVENLFFAGRNISATHVAFASTRVMGTCSVMGQAIGTAAALATVAIRNRSDMAESFRSHASVSVSALGEDRSVTANFGSSSLEAAHAVASANEVAPSIASIFDETTVAHLQQTLLKDDAFLPGLSDEDPRNLVRGAHVVASSETADGRACSVSDGVTRELCAHLGPWADGAKHRWESAALPAWIEMRWLEMQSISEIHLTFDSGFQRELILSASDAHNRKVIRGPQPELVRDYDLLLDGVSVVSVRGNVLRKRVHRLPASVSARQLRLEIRATHGVDHARVFEIRAY